jgi:hypothetical protein
MKPLLSELFLPCSGMLSPIRANRYPLTTITGAQRASGQTHSRARSHQDGADLRADRSTAYRVSCIRVRSAHGNSFFCLDRMSYMASRLSLHVLWMQSEGENSLRNERASPLSWTGPTRGRLSGTRLTAGPFACPAASLGTPPGAPKVATKPARKGMEHVNRTICDSGHSEGRA